MKAGTKILTSQASLVSIVIFIVAACLAFLAIFRLNNVAKNELSALPTPVPTAAAVPSATLFPDRTVVIHASDYLYEPNTITVVKNARVRLSLVVDSGMHDLKVEKYLINPGITTTDKTNSITFEATMSGRFEFGSTLHPKMKGYLVVLPD